MRHLLAYLFGIVSKQNLWKLMQLVFYREMPFLSYKTREKNLINTNFVPTFSMHIHTEQISHKMYCWPCKPCNQPHMIIPTWQSMCVNDDLDLVPSAKIFATVAFSCNFKQKCSLLRFINVPMFVCGACNFCWGFCQVH